MSNQSSPADEVRPGVLRTPDRCFTSLPGFSFGPHYHEIAGYRVHYLDEGDPNGHPILLLHGEPTWSYLYRHMIPVLTKAGFRCIVPDLIGFGRSDKPVDRSVHTYKFHVDTMAELIATIDLKSATFFGQDWGGLIGLRVVTENPGRFARIVVSNTGLPTGDEKITPAFLAWREMSQQMIDMGDMPIGAIVSGTARRPEIEPAYDAPFPEPRFKAGPLSMPQLVPISPEDPANGPNRKAWSVLREWNKPFLTAFGDRDPITAGADKKFQEVVPGAVGQPHTLIKGAGHFIQETHGEELARVIADFIAETN